MTDEQKQIGELRREVAYWKAEVQFYKAFVKKTHGPMIADSLNHSWEQKWMKEHPARAQGYDEEREESGL